MTNTNDLNEQKRNEFYGFVYMTTNLINGKRYIGQRKYYGKHQDYLGSGHLLRRAVEKYGKENFSRVILEECSSREQLNNQEKFWIQYYDAVNDNAFYNISAGGEGVVLANGQSVWLGRQHSDETKAKLSQLRMGVNNPFYGKHHSPETIKKLAQYSTGKKHSPETLRKMSIGMRQNHADYNGAKNPRARRTAQYSLSGELLHIWECAKDAATALNLNYCSITNCCTGRYNSSGGFIWRYIE